MNTAAIVNFLQSLSQKTIDGEIEWNYINELMAVSMEDNKSLYFALFQNEYHRIDTFNSFYAQLHTSGYIYILDETTEPGRDNSYVQHRLNVYIQKDLKAELIRLEVELAYIYQLQNAIKSSLFKKEKEIEDFIKDYFEN